MAAIVKEERIGGQRETLIYALLDPRTDEVRYIGKTQRSPRKRHNEHIQDAFRKHRLPVQRWTKHLYDNGSWSCLKHLEYVQAGGDWAAREKHWIDRFRSDGARLLNLTDGGEGLMGHHHSPQTKEKIGAKLRRGASFSCENCGSSFWRKPRDIKVGNNKFCSRKCYHSSTKGVSKDVPEVVWAAGQKASAAKAKARTHCRNGHELTPENVYINPRGARVCKICRRRASIDCRKRNK